ncbi:MAG: fasciclin domain-containing protein [Planctomycetes bacterium]|nr:fasciclin domain-containing protein [Planctomycetota bacterium]
MKPIALALALGLCSQLPAPAASGPAASGASTITDLVASSGGVFDSNPFDYDLLLNAVLAAGLEGALADPNVDLTVFAPNDLAFIRLARDLGYTGTDETGSFQYIVGALTTLGGGDPIPVLTDVLLYHVAPESLSPKEITKNRAIDTLQGGKLEFTGSSLKDAEPGLRDPRLFLGSKVRASNGLVYTLDRVLIPLDLP